MSLPIFKRARYINLIQKQLKAESADPDDEADVDIDSIRQTDNDDDYEDY